MSLLPFIISYLFPSLLGAYAGDVVKTGEIETEATGVKLPVLSFRTAKKTAQANKWKYIMITVAMIGGFVLFGWFYRLIKK